MLIKCLKLKEAYKNLEFMKDKKKSEKIEKNRRQRGKRYKSLRI
jgi:hypothetical protein